MMRRKWWKTESSENLGMAQLTASMLAGLAYSMYAVSDVVDTESGHRQ
jgi:hypothetical protein